MTADYIMIGGFLGAGKTTAVLALARHLRATGKRVGLITNDQSVGLVDTALTSFSGFEVEEITGGCFCCRFTTLTEAADRLQDRLRPDVFIAEPVGSCTDLRASVSYPLRRLYGSAYRVAPLSVLVDPVRASRVFDLQPGRSFSPRVRYVYEKQLEEADLIVINKIDAVDPATLHPLRDALGTRFRRARILAISARTGEGLAAWFEEVLSSDMPSVEAPEVDYDIYADGEARLGWLNAALRVGHLEGGDGNALVERLAAAVQQRLAQEHVEVAHLKMTLTPDELAGDIAALNLVRSDGRPELSHRLVDPLAAGELLVNLRAEATPDSLRVAVTEALDTMRLEGAWQLSVQHVEAFSPPRPTPTHRMAIA